MPRRAEAAHQDEEDGMELESPYMHTRNKRKVEEHTSDSEKKHTDDDSEKSQHLKNKRLESAADREEKREHVHWNPNGRVCIKVPHANEHQLREEYERFGDDDTRRDNWTKHLLGPNGRYAGRPKNDGGWYKVPMVKHGSFLANPFPLKLYSLSSSLHHYREYINKRIQDDCTTEDLISLLPENEAQLAEKFYITDVGSGSGKSMAHYEFNVHGREFRKRLLDLDGCRLGCFCDLDSPCHVDIILETIDQLKKKPT